MSRNTAHIACLHWRFLLGVKPDACILVVNSIDTEEYIRDTIDGIRAGVQSTDYLAWRWATTKNTSGHGLWAQYDHAKKNGTSPN